MQPAESPRPVTGAELREASFPRARRGYDREAVHEFLNRVADWVEETVSDTSGQLTSEFAKVGERTAGILTAAEEAAAKLRREAKEFDEEVRREATAQAQSIRTAAEEEARNVLLKARQRSDELIAEAESKAETIIDEAIARRRQLNQAVTSLIERREEIADQVQRLADGLLADVESIRVGDESEQADEVEGEEPLFADPAQDEAERARLIRAGFQPGGAAAGEPTQLEPDDERETRIQESG
jgi:DivIVA domain-containing protein